MSVYQPRLLNVTYRHYWSPSLAWLMLIPVARVIRVDAIAGSTAISFAAMQVYYYRRAVCCCYAISYTAADNATLPVIMLLVIQTLLPKMASRWLPLAHCYHLATRYRRWGHYIINIITLLSYLSSRWNSRLDYREHGTGHTLAFTTHYDRCVTLLVAPLWLECLLLLFYVVNMIIEEMKSDEAGLLPLRYV